MRDLQNNIPECPHCKKPTRRQQGASTCTAVYCPDVYDKNGQLEPKTGGNTVTTTWHCLDCNQTYEQ